MRSSAWILCVCALAATFGASGDAGQSAAPRSSWNRVVAGDIEAIGEVSSGELRRAVGEIASFRSTVGAVYTGWRVDSAAPTRVVVFPHRLAFQRFSPRDDLGRPMQSVGGYFSAGPTHNILTIGAGGRGTLFHEYAHFLLNRNFHALPTWLSEGLADFFSTYEADFRNAKSVIGRPPASRILALRRGSIPPLRRVLFASPSEIEVLWRDPGSIETFYATSWALVHYLMIGRDNGLSPAFGAYVAALERGTMPETAFRDAYGDVDDIAGALRSYVRRFLFPAFTFELAGPLESALTETRLSEADARSVQGALLLEVTAYDEGKREFEAATKIEPSHLASRIGLARLVVARGDLPDAIAALQHIAKSAPDDFAASYYLADALSRAGLHEEALVSYRRALTLNDQSPYAWWGYSLSAVARGRATDGQDAMNEAMRLQANPEWYRDRAYAALRLGLDSTAAIDIHTYMNLAAQGSHPSVYASFVAAIAYWRLGQPAAAMQILDEGRHGLAPASWTSSVIDFLQERLPEQRFLGRARTQAERTEAHTYIGFKDAITGRRDAALKHFQWVRDQGSKTSSEYEMAIGELRRLQAR